MKRLSEIKVREHLDNLLKLLSFDQVSWPPVGWNKEEEEAFLSQLKTWDLNPTFGQEGQERCLSISAGNDQEGPLSPSWWLKTFVMAYQLEQYLHYDKMSSWEDWRAELFNSSIGQEWQKWIDSISDRANRSSEYQGQMVSCLERSCESHQSLKVEIGPDHFHYLYPWKLIHLEGQLSIVAEDCRDKCLISFPVTALKSVHLQEMDYESELTIYEVEEFISAVRLMNESETRLVLKINDPESVNLFPTHHFLGKPCMITNPMGDLIWAAYVEPCEDLFVWLADMGNKVEILDPLSFKEQFSGFCETKLKKVA